MEWLNIYTAAFATVTAAVGGGVGWLFRNRRDNMSAIIDGFKDLKDLTAEELAKTISERDEARMSKNQWRRHCEYCEAHLKELFEILDLIIEAADDATTDWGPMIAEARERVETLKRDRQEERRRRGG